MHHHLEIIMPPVQDVNAAVSMILDPFDENHTHENHHVFWDWWVIGGRWSGHKVECGLDPEAVKAFNEALKRWNVTVSGFQAGKQSLEPATQIPMVDQLFKEYFPDSTLKACPFFAHFNDQYRDSDGFPDIMRLGDIPEGLDASRVIVAQYHWSDKAKLQAAYMVTRDAWNGVTWQNTTWDGKVYTAVNDWKESIDRNYTEEFKSENTPTDDWLVVTVDYHS